MAARTFPANASCNQFPFYVVGVTFKLLEASRAGDAAQVYADMAIWDSTANSFVDPSKVQNLISGNIGLI